MERRDFGAVRNVLYLGAGEVPLLVQVREKIERFAMARPIRVVALIEGVGRCVAEGEYRILAQVRSPKVDEELTAVEEFEVAGQDVAARLSASVGRRVRLEISG